MKLIRTILAAWFLSVYNITKATKSGCYGKYCFTMSQSYDPSEKLSQTSAQQWCRANKSQLLAEIFEKDFQDSFKNFVLNSIPQPMISWTIITNGKNNQTDWLRLNGNGRGQVTISEQEGDLFKGYGYLRSSENVFNIYAAIPTDSRINGYICSAIRDCKDGVDFNGICYKSYSDSLSWYDARNRCLDGGGDLASFEFVNSNGGFNALNGSWIDPSRKYWVGFRREWWTWQGSNSEVKYSDWSSQQPSNAGNCICIYIPDSRNPPWQWIPCNCEETRPFLCISENRTVSSNAVSSTTTTIASSKSTATSVVKLTSSAPSAHLQNSETTVTITFIRTTANITDNVSSESKSTDQEQNGIAIGLGVGLPLVVIIAVLATMLVIEQRRNRKNTNDNSSKPSHHSADNSNEPENKNSYPPMKNNSNSAMSYEPLQFGTNEVIQQNSPYQELNHLTTSEKNNYESF